MPATDAVGKPVGQTVQTTTNCKLIFHLISCCAFRKKLSKYICGILTANELNIYFKKIIIQILIPLILSCSSGFGSPRIEQKKCG